MHRSVRTQRHVAVLDLVAYLSKLARLSIHIQPSPLRKIQKLSSGVNVVDDEPRHGNHIRVPRPRRLIRVTIDARTIEDRGHLRRHLRARENRLRFIDWRICPSGPHKLRGKKQTDQNDGSPLGNSNCGFHPRFNRPLMILLTQNYHHVVVFQICNHNIGFAIAVQITQRDAFRMIANR